MLRCDSLVGKGAGSQCAHFVFAKDEPQPLSKELYQKRNVAWSGKDYSGLSLYEFYPVEILRPLFDETTKEYVLGYRTRAGEEKGIDGGIYKPSAICQAYPEKDSPFKQGVADKYFTGITNVCERSKDDYSDGVEKKYQKECQCSYIKVTYGNGAKIRWWDYGESNLPPSTCDKERHYLKGGGNNCEKFPYESSKKERVIGLENYCLEKDPSRPEEIGACLTWWPGASVGGQDIYEQYREAGFDVEEKIGDKYYYGAGRANKSFGFNNVPSSCQYMGANAGKDLGPYSPQHTVYKNEIKSINITVSSNDYWDPKCAGPCEVGCWCSEGWWGNAHGKESTWKIPCSYSAEEMDSGTGYMSGWAGWIYGTRKGKNSTTTCRGEETKDTEGGVRIKGNFSSGQLTGVDIHGKDGNYGTKSDFEYSGGNWCLAVGRPDVTGGVFMIDKLNLSSQSGINQIAKIADASKGKPWTNRIYGYDTSYPALSESNNWGASGLSRTPKRLRDALESSKWDSLEKIRNYFAESYGVWTLGDNLTYVKSSGWNDAADYPQDAPETAAVGAENDEVREHPMTINDKTSEDIEPNTSSLTAVLKFYAWADKNHMPIREVAVDWGDNSFPTGLYSEMKGKNRREDCDSKDPNQGWGGNKTYACTEGYFQFVHTYICQQGGPGYNRNDNRCHFKPRVFIKDNWGWCNGGSYAGDNTCYPDRGKEYDGQIILIPAEE